MKLMDGHGRRASYLRASVTDRCNFNCVYCRDGISQKHIPAANILRFSEIERLAAICVKLGIGKVRITGGEPFMRKGVVEFMARLRKNYPDIALSVTTNGSLLEPHISDLKKIGLSSINLSLDSFRPDTFEKLTGGGDLRKVLASMDAALGKNLKLKINVVAIRGVTDIELDDYLYAVKTLPIDLRFIEFMPLGANTKWNDSLFLSAGEIQEAIKSRMPVAPANPAISGQEDRYSGPARIYEIPGAMGRVGFISSMSNHFCSNCNRLRVTADGALRSCLFASKEYKLRGLLRKKEGEWDERIARLIRKICKSKPLGSEIIRNRKSVSIIESPLASIGG